MNDDAQWPPEWPPELPAVQVRFARQTDRLEEIRRFYCVGLGLKSVAEFQGHAGYDGLMIGLPGTNYHLEFVHHEDGSPGDSTNEENLLVFYMPDVLAIARLAKRLTEMGYKQVDSANPYWDQHGAITIEDPDGWRVVLQPGHGL